MRTAAIGVVLAVLSVGRAADAQGTKYVVEAKITVSTFVGGTEANTAEQDATAEGQAVFIRSTVWSCRQSPAHFTTLKGGSALTVPLRCTDGRSTVMAHAACYQETVGDKGFGAISLEVGDVGFNLFVRCVTTNRPVAGAAPAAPQPVVFQ